MELTNIFFPPRRQGLIVHGLIAVFLLAGSISSFWLAFQESVGSYFVLLLLLALVFTAPIPFVMYRGYALLQASYTIERDGLRLRWGLRAEDIPLPDVEWIRPVEELGFRLPLPHFYLPGAILGVRNIQDLGPVEFMSSELASMLLIATPKKIYAISPENLKAFVRTFQRTTELGSLAPLPSHSTQPAAYLQQIWNDRAARYMMLAGLFLTMTLFVLDSLLIPTRSSISLGFDGNNQPLPPGPPEQLLLLPVLASFAFLIDLVIGMYFYRRLEQRPVSYLLLACSSLTPILLIIATFFMK